MSMPECLGLAGFTRAEYHEVTENPSFGRRSDGAPWPGRDERGRTIQASLLAYHLLGPPPKRLVLAFAEKFALLLLRPAAQKGVRAMLQNVIAR